MARDSLVCSQLSDSRWVGRRRPTFVSVGFPLASPFFGVVPDMGDSLLKLWAPNMQWFPNDHKKWFDDVFSWQLKGGPSVT